MAAQAKTFSYEVSLDRDGTVWSGESGTPIPSEEGWTPEHLLLAGLARCTLTSLDYHARRIGIESGGDVQQGRAHATSSPLTVQR